ncbi:DUF2231 domain-containing protein [Aquabacterium sp. A7-Y]|uniref:DUF2231 domain-containing protein n=1 Tax=Aquabacterium sp. A7-Y TaxID=1349605 RepID=UPI00223D503E|nr:DUF2231 domain-containing protein [Aquabacterium sp. A7-Y]MCW7537226.1 DUF2231 domain-containing protein [Aquabacterium sp. A7-Y]
MESRAKLLGHPVHQVLVVFPLGLLSTAVIFDLIFLANNDPMMSAVAYWLVAAGLVGAFAAAPFGTRDWLAIPSGTRAKRIGALHGGGNLVVTLLFLGSWMLRPEPPGPSPWLALLLSFAGAALALVTGWLGGELVDRLGVGVSDDAHVDAPSSLSKRGAATAPPREQPWARPR